MEGLGGGGFMSYTALSHSSELTLCSAVAAAGPEREKLTNDSLSVQARTLIA